MTGILIILLLILLYNSYGYYKKQLLFNNISTIGTIQSAFDELILVTPTLDAKYKILLPEKKYINMILNSFDQDIKTKYFSQKLTLDWKTVSLNYHNYFFLYLYLYLKEHEDDLFFANSEYQIYTSKKDLLHSEFGIAYKRIQLIAAYYCHQSKAILKINPFLKTSYEREKNYFDNYILQK